MTAPDTISLGYLLASALFLLALRHYRTPHAAGRGHQLAGAGMVLAMAATFFSPAIVNFKIILAGLAVGTLLAGVATVKLKIATPRLLTLFAGCGGMATTLVAFAEFKNNGLQAEPFTLTALLLALIFGSVTVAGSIAAQHQAPSLALSRALGSPLRQLSNAAFLLATFGSSLLLINDPSNSAAFNFMLACAFAFAFSTGRQLGAAELPVTVALLNSTAGLAAAMTGLAFANQTLLVAGSLLASGSLVLARRLGQTGDASLFNLLCRAWGAPAKNRALADSESLPSIKEEKLTEIVQILKNANRVIFIPGHGLAAAQAHQAMRDLGDDLTELGVEVRYALHPRAGRVAGQIAGLLAEVKIPAAQIFSLKEINDQFATTAVALVVGADDVVNPALTASPASPLQGLPACHAEQAQRVVVLKRTLAQEPGNVLFRMEHTLLYFGDAKRSLQAIRERL